MSKGSNWRKGLNMSNYWNASYWDKDLPIEERFKKFLGEDGIKFFTELYNEHGALNVILSNDNGTKYAYLHSVHFNEGMQVRNWMRKQKEFKEQRDKEAEGQAQFDDLWQEFVITSLNLKKENTNS